ncbi:MAG: hypothetical protein ACE5FF_04085 [Saprospiraceae bacterium]
MQKLLAILLICTGLFWSCGHDAPLANEQPVPDSLAIAPTNSSPLFTGFLKSYRGLFENGKEIEMVLVNWGDGFLSGHYLYTGIGTPLELNGEMLDSTHFELIESHNFKDTGSFRCDLTNTDTLSGIWSNPAKTVRLAFKLAEVQSSGDNQRWTGNWHMNEIWDNGTLMIGNVTKDSFDFALNVVRSGHIGTLQGRAAVHDDRALFNKQEYEDEACSIQFEHHGDFIAIEQQSSNFACGFGARAYVGGIYEKKLVLKTASLSVGKDGVFPDSILHEAFKKLVGDSIYSIFAFNMQMTEPSRVTLKNGDSITVNPGFVAGLLGINEAIIGYGEDGRIWAATLDVDEFGDDVVVKYFTNDENYAAHPPKFIEDWRDGFDDYPLISMGN